MAKNQPTQLTMEWSREIAAVMETVVSGLPSRDRGECGELNADTMTRCDGRMMAEYIEATPLLAAFPVWVCSCCERKYLP